jgi:hypothetical protein
MYGPGQLVAPFSMVFFTPTVAAACFVFKALVLLVGVSTMPDGESVVLLVGRTEECLHGALIVVVGSGSGGCRRVEVVGNWRMVGSGHFFWLVVERSLINQHTLVLPTTHSSPPQTPLTLTLLFP